MAEIGKSPAVAKRDWKQIIEDSNGTLTLAPEKLQPAIKEWAEKRAAFSKRVNEISKMEAEVSVTFQNLIYSIRKHFADAGRDDVWSADVGIEANALKEGVLIVNIVQPQK